MLSFMNKFRSDHKIHMPDRHELSVKLEHLVHNESFWAIVAAIVLLGLFLAVALWATLTGSQPPRAIPPYYPYGF